MKMNGKKPVVIEFMSDIDQETAGTLMSCLYEVKREGYDEIHLFISSMGGSVEEGITVYNNMRRLDLPITTYNSGHIYSIGNVIFQGGERRVATPNSCFMFHGVSIAGIKSTPLDIPDIEEILSSMKNSQLMIDNVIKERTSIDDATIEELSIGRTYIDCRRALDLGIIDEIGDVDLPAGVRVIPLFFK